MTRRVLLRFFTAVVALALSFQVVAAGRALADAAEGAKADQDKAWFLSFIESRLSAPNRQIRISNIDGVLSSNASVGLITVADRQGVWLRINGAKLDWNRSALLLGRISINALSADRIEVLRKPVPELSAPKPEAGGFTLPDLPVAVMIDSLKVRQVLFSEQIFGVASVVSLAGHFSLADGVLSSKLDIARLDDPGGQFRLLADYSRESRSLNLDLELSEPANGIAANLLKIEDRPPLDLVVKGGGTLDNLAVTLKMEASGRPALNGLFTLQPADEGRRFSLVADGPVAGLMPGIYQPFFGPDTKLNADGVLKPGGGMRLDRISLEGGPGVRLSGRAEMAGDGFLRQLVLDAHFAAPNGGALVLPVRGGKTAAEAMVLHVAYGMAHTQSWTGRLAVQKLATNNLRAGDLTLDMGGPAENLDDPGRRHVGVIIKGGLHAMNSPHPEIARALGSHIDININTDWRAGTPVAIKNLDVNAERLALFIRGTVEKFVFRGDAGINCDNFAPFSDLVGRPLAGKANMKVHGMVGLLDGAFDLDLDGTASGLQTGNAVADRLFKSDVTLSGGVGRTVTGISARSLRVSSKQAEITANGRFSSETADLDFGLSLPDTALVDRRIQGPLVLTGAARGHNSLVAIGMRGFFANGIWNGRRLANAAVSFNGVLDRTSPVKSYVSGLLKGDGLYGGEKLALSAAFHEEDDQAVLDGLDVSVGGARLSGNLTKGEDGLFNGRLHLDSADISTLAALAFTQGRGAARIDAVLEAKSGRQNAAIDADIKALALADTRIDALQMRAALSDLFGVPQLDGVLDGSVIHLGGYDVRSVHVTSRLQQNASHFVAETVLENGTSTSAAGVLAPLAGGGWQLSLERAGLHYQNMDAALLRPAKVLFETKDHISISDLAMRIGKGSLSVNGTLAETVNLDVAMQDLPLAAVNLVRPDLGLGGTLSGTAHITGSRVAPSLDFDVTGSAMTAGILRKNGIAPLDLAAQGKTVNQVLDLQARLSGAGLNAQAQEQVFIAQRKLDLDIDLKDTPLSVLNGFVKNQNLKGRVSGTAHVSDAFSNPAVTFSMKGNSLAAKLLADSGLAPVQLSAQGSYKDHVLDLDALDLSGPKGLGVKVSGRMPVAGRGLDLRLDGAVPLTFANALLAGRGSQVAGLLTVHTGVRGSFQVPLLTGSFALANGQFVDPQLNIRLNGIAVSGKLDGDQLIFERASASSASGGTVSLTGWMSTDTTRGLVANLALDLNHARYNDGNMLAATVSGKINVAGPLLRDPAITGNIIVEKADITVLDNFGGATLIDVRHRHLTPPIARTLNRAGINGRRSAAAVLPLRALGPRLDVQISAPNRVFVRGRGLDVELRGQLRLVGSVTDIHPVGGFNMVRGRLDILAQRLVFREGQVTMTGNMNPELHFVAVSDDNDMTVTVNVDGTPQDLKITFASQPPLPQDEVLARLIFKRSLSELSPFQIAQLVDATAELAGITSRSVLGSLRAGTGLDRLDIITDALGHTGVEAGRYIKDKLYLGVETAVGGASKGTVNLDINSHLKAKGTVGSDSTSNVGLFYEKDY